MRERRLVFGEVAELYDRHRPTYPEQLIDGLVAEAALDGSQAVLEVGAGTGKATALFVDAASRWWRSSRAPRWRPSHGAAWGRRVG